MKPIERIETKMRKTQETREQLKNEIEELTHKLVMDAAEAQAAAEADDLERYMDLKGDQERTAALIEMKKIQLDKVADVPESEIMGAWKDYADHDYLPEFNKAVQALDDAKAKYLDAFRKLLITQNNGLLEQMRFGKLMGLEPGQNFPTNHATFNLIDRLPMRTFSIANAINDRTVSFRGKAKQPDLAIYLSVCPDTLAETVLGAKVPVLDENKL